MPEEGEWSAEEQLASSDEDLPDLDFAGERITDADPVLTGRGVTQAGEAVPSQRAAASVDWESTAGVTAQRGRRGEEWAFAKERERVAKLGMDPQLVVWQSRRDPLSNFDIRSVDDDGVEIYIEVKSTAALDPATPFDISAGELLLAETYGERYLIHRVYDVNAAVPGVVRFRDPWSMVQRGEGELRYTSARMWLSG